MLQTSVMINDMWTHWNAQWKKECVFVCVFVSLCVQVTPLHDNEYTPKNREKSMNTWTKTACLWLLSKLWVCSVCVMHEAALHAGGHTHTFLLHNAKDIFLFTVPSGLNLTPLLQQAVSHKVIPPRGYSTQGSRLWPLWNKAKSTWWLLVTHPKSEVYMGCEKFHKKWHLKEL